MLARQTSRIRIGTLVAGDRAGRRFREAVHSVDKLLRNDVTSWPAEYSRSQLTTEVLVEAARASLDRIGGTELVGA